MDIYCLHDTKRWTNLTFPYTEPHMGHVPDAALMFFLNVYGESRM